MLNLIYFQLDYLIDVNVMDLLVDLYKHRYSKYNLNHYYCLLNLILDHRCVYYLNNNNYLYVVLYLIFDLKRSHTEKMMVNLRIIVHLNYMMEKMK